MRKTRKNNLLVHLDSRKTRKKTIYSYVPIKIRKGLAQPNKA